ncbi:MAG: Mpo1-like protein [Spirochaetota bacterium]
MRHYAWRRDHYRTLQEFWPFYLHEHSSVRNRLLHFVGSTLGLFVFAIAVGISNYVLVIPALVSGYAFAWFGHFFIEKNRPATFKYPLKSFISDWRMWYTMLTGRIAAELRKFGIESRP